MENFQEEKASVLFFVSCEVEVGEAYKVSMGGPYKSGWNKKTKAMKTTASKAMMKAVVPGFIGTLRND